MRKFFALTLALALAASMTVSAAPSPTSGSSSSSSSTSADASTAVVAVPAAAAVSAIEQRAASLGRSVASYAANAVISTPGIPDAVPIAQGGGCVINGAASNATFTLNPVESGTAAFALSQAKAVGGTALNVVDISAPGVNFANAEVGFYVGGVKAGDNIAVYQSVKGAWVAVEVTEVANNTVKIKMNKAGIYCFIKL